MNKQNQDSWYSPSVVQHRAEILNLLLPLFPEIGGAGIYISQKLKAELGVAGNEISITLYKSRHRND
jgi:hypothetical protein